MHFLLTGKHARFMDMLATWFRLPLCVVWFSDTWSMCSTGS